MANNSFGAIPPLTINGSSGMALTQSNVVIGNSNPFAGLNTINISSDWDNPNVKRYEVIEINKDLLSLSAAWYRIRKARTSENPGTVFPEKLLDKVLFNEVISEDIQLAADIRDYYSKKIMLWKLKGNNLSKFREDMNTFVHSDGLTFREDMIPLVYRLPEFYIYDKEFDVMASEHVTKIKTTNTVTTKRLNLLKTFNCSKRYSKRKEYWFNDEEDQLVKMQFVADNPLLPLLDLYAQDEIIVKGLFTKMHRDDKEYLFSTKQTFI